MKFLYKALFIFILSLLCVFSLYSNSAKPSENNKDNAVYKTVYKIKLLREDLIKSFPGSSLEERHRFAADKRKEMGIFLSQLLKNGVLNSSEVRELYNEMMQWKGIVNEYTAISAKETAINKAYMANIENLKNDLLLAPWDISKNYDNEIKIRLLLQQKTTIEKSITKSIYSVIDPVDDFKLCSKLTEKDVLVDYYKVWIDKKSSYLVFTLERGSCEPVLTIIPNGLMVDKLINDIERSILQRETPEIFELKTMRLRALIWDQVEKQFSIENNVFISPDGAVTTFPFGMLAYDDGKYLVQKFNIVHLISPRSLLKKNSQEQNLTVFTNIPFNTLEKNTMLLYSKELTECSWYYGEDLDSYSKTFLEKLKSLSLVVISGQDVTMQKIRMTLKEKSLYYIDSVNFSARCSKLEDAWYIKSLLLEYQGSDIYDGMFLSEGFWTSDGYVITEEILYGGFEKGSNVILPFSVGLGKNFIDGEGRTGPGAAFLISGAYSVLASPLEVPMDLPESIIVPYLKQVSAGKNREASFSDAQRRFIEKNQFSHPLEWGAVMLIL